MIPKLVAQAYGFDAQTDIRPLGAGHIHKTFLVDSAPSTYVLQRINHFVFRRPDLIMKNISLADDYLKKYHPDYTFLSVIRTNVGAAMVYDEEGYPWRLFPFIDQTVTLEEIHTREQAYEGARGFGLLTRNLEGCEVALFAPTIERFHDLSWRYEQFEQALAQAGEDRKTIASEAIQQAVHFSYLVDRYHQLISSGSLVLRVTHNDTKINNILFDRETGKARCVIDLDTLMPGYFIYDLGDMMRTFISPVSEEEKDLLKIVFRSEMYDALVSGYLEVMGDVLTDAEKTAIPFSGLMMTYIMALRFLADYLNGDVYYTIHYEGQNLNRARNQLRLLQVLSEQLGQ